MSNEIPVSVSVGLVDQLSQKLDALKNKFPEMSQNVGKLKNNFDFLQESTKGFREKVEGFSKAVGPKLAGIGKAMTVGITLPVVAGATYSVKKFSEFEDALTDVQGATDLSGDSLKAYGEKIRALSLKTTFSTGELLEMTSAAGEAGVRGSDNLANFTLAMAQLGKTAKITGPEAAQTLKDILSNTKEGVGSVLNFGSAITELENKYGVSAKKIFEATGMITRETGKFGVSATQAAAFAAAIVPMGFEAKNAGQAVAESFRGIDGAIREGGMKMIGLQKITGMTGDELKKQFKDNPQAVFEAFIKGLSKIEQNGGETTKALEFFGISGDKTGVILTKLGKDTSKLAEIQATAADAFTKNTALQEEYDDTTKTLSSTMKKLHNNVDNLAQSLGNNLAPIVNFAANAIGGMLNFFREHPVIATFVAAIGGFLAVLGPLLIAAGEFIKMWGTAMTIINGVSAAWAVLTGIEWASVAATIAAIGPWLLLAAVIGGIIAAIWIFRDAIMKGIVAAWDWVIEKIQSVIELLKSVTDVMSSGVLKFTPLGAMAAGANLLLNKIQPNAPATGVANTAAQASPEFATQTNNARVDVFVRAPQSTQVVGEDNNGIMSINRGLVGAF